MEISPTPAKCWLCMNGVIPVLWPLCVAICGHLNVLNLLSGGSYCFHSSFMACLSYMSLAAIVWITFFSVAFCTFRSHWRHSLLSSFSYCWLLCRISSPALRLQRAELMKWKFSPMELHEGASNCWWCWSCHLSVDQSRPYLHTLGV